MPRLTFPGLIAALWTAGAGLSPSFAAPLLDPLTGKPFDDLPVAPASADMAAPDYPLPSLVARWEGFVRLAVTIGDDGAVDAADVVFESSAGHSFGENAAETVRTWKFPGSQPGRYRLKLAFRLPDGVTPATEPPPMDCPEPVERAQGRPKPGEAKYPQGQCVIELVLNDDGTVASSALIYRSPDNAVAALSILDQYSRSRFPAGAPGKCQVGVSWEIR